MPWIVKCVWSLYSETISLFQKWNINKVIFAKTHHTILNLTLYWKSQEKVLEKWIFSVLNAKNQQFYFCIGCLANIFIGLFIKTFINNKAQKMLRVFPSKILENLVFTCHELKLFEDEEKADWAVGCGHRILQIINTNSVIKILAF